MLSSTVRKQKNTSKEIINSKLLFRLGNFLKSVREKKYLTLSDVQNLTNIDAYHLDLIEKGMRENLPEDIFLIGFIKKYSKALGLRDEVIFNELSSYIRTRSEDGFDLLFSTRNNNNIVKIKTTSKIFGNIYIVLLFFLLSTAGYVVFKEFRKIADNESKFSHVLVDKDKKFVVNEPEISINLNEVESWVLEEEIKEVPKKEIPHNPPKIGNASARKISSLHKAQKIQSSVTNKVQHKQLPKPKPVLISKTVVKSVPLKTTINQNQAAVQQFKRIMID